MTTNDSNDRSPAMTKNITSMDADELRGVIAPLIAERDLRFYDEEDLYRGAVQTAGESVRRAQREPLLDAQGAEAFAAALQLALPAMTCHDLVHLIYCLRRCPKAPVAA
jgi:hypothetical protein